MPDAIYDNMFHGYRVGGWHRLGKVKYERETATEAFEEMGSYRLVEVPARIAIPGEVMREYSLTDEVSFDTQSGYKGIMRPPFGSDHQWRLFGVVRESYRLVQPREFVETADRATSNRGIDTIGVLDKGKAIFLAYDLPDIDVRGDQHKVWVSAINEMDGSGSLRLCLTGERWVCRNTVENGWMIASERHRIRHDANVLLDMEFWLQSMIGKVESNVAALKEVFEILAGASVTEQLVKNTLEVAYPHRERPNLRGVRNKERVDEMLANIENHNQRMDRFRLDVRHFFEGAATGYGHPNMRGTAYGLYNSLVEHEDFRKGRARESALVGSRAQTKARGYRTIAEGIGLIGKN